MGSVRDASSERRAATSEEMRALAHPLRLRIIRLTNERALTNKQLAVQLGRDPGTVLYHVRVLVDAGFLAVQEVRTGARGARERPYLSTGKSWRISLAGQDSLKEGAAAVLAAFTDELTDAGEYAVLDYTRVALRLRLDRRAALQGALEKLIDSFVDEQDQDGEPLALLYMLHRSE